MLTEEQKEQIQNQEIPDDLDMTAQLRVSQSKEAHLLGMDEEVWTEALSLSGPRNIIQDGTYDHHMPQLGPWKQDVGIDFTAQVRETGEIVFHAQMFKATITRKETLSHRDQQLASAVMDWNPESEVTQEFVAEFIRHNHPTDTPAAQPGPEQHLTVMDTIRLLHNFPGDTPVLIPAAEIGVYRPLGTDSADVALMTAPDPATPGWNENLRRVRVGEPMPKGHHQVCAIGLYNSPQG